METALLFKKCSRATLTKIFSRHADMDYTFASDNVMGVHPESMTHIIAANTGAVASYGEDAYTEEAVAAVKALFGKRAQPFFVFNGGAANSLALASLTRPFEAIACHGFAHVSLDECNAPEFFTSGSKLIPVDGADGKIDLEKLRAATEARDDVHFPRVRTLSITQSTEVGTVYALDELGQLRQVKEDLGLRLHMDGARFAHAVAHLNCAPSEIVEAGGVDALSLGLVKIGVGLVECLILFDADVADGFAYRQKQACQLGSKMRMGTAPIAPALKTGCWIDWAKHANDRAKQLAEGLQALGIPPVFPVQANGVFVRFPEDSAKALREQGWQFYDFVADTQRLMCHWATEAAIIDRFLDDVDRVMG